MKDAILGMNQSSSQHALKERLTHNQGLVREYERLIKIRNGIRDHEVQSAKEFRRAIRLRRESEFKAWLEDQRHPRKNPY